MIRSSLSFLLLLAVAMLLAAPRAASAAESYDNCTGYITSIPAVITSQGTWCLKQDLATAMTSGRAIDVQANNVTIDCNGFKIDGLAAGLSTFAQGISSDNRLNTTVRRCSVSGFLNGIIMEPTSTSCGGHVVEDNRLDGNRLTGIQVLCDGSLIRRNRVFDTGRSTLYFAAYAIVARYSVDVLDNVIANVTSFSASDYATGIWVYQDDGRVSGNRIRGLGPNGGGVGTERAIYSQASGRMVMRNNDMMGNAGSGSQGMNCDSTTVRAKDNVIIGFQTDFSGCSDDGGNVLAP